MSIDLSQPLAVSQDLYFQNVLEFRRQVVRAQHRRDTDHLLGLDKMKGRLASFQARTKKMRK